MYKKGLSGWLKHWDFVLIDVIVQQLCLIIAYILRNGFSFLTIGYIQYAPVQILMFLLNIAVGSLFGSFHNVLKRGKFKELIMTLKHCTLILMGIMLYVFATRTGLDYSRIVVITTYGLHTVLGYVIRLLYKYIRKRNPNTKNRAMLVITTREYAERAIEILKSDITNTIGIIGLAITDEDLVGQTIDSVQIVANKDTVCRYACREWVSEIFMYYPTGITGTVSELYNQLIQSGIVIHIDLGSIMHFTNMDPQIERFGSSNVLTLSVNSAKPLQLFEKRLMDIIAGIFGSLAALVIMAVIAIPLKKQSPGPLLYSSERIGIHGKRFKMLKIRSMYLDADERKQELMSQNRIADGMMFKLDWDPRIIGNKTLPDGTKKTGLGEFIRKTSLDEFPQFFNVLKGDMSLVGTRPPTPDEWEKYDLHHRSRMATKPGITGMWQVSGRSEITDFEEVVRLDNEYITSWSPTLDWKILFKTVEIVLNGRGAM